VRRAVATEAARPSRGRAHRARALALLAALVCAGAAAQETPVPPAVSGGPGDGPPSNDGHVVKIDVHQFQVIKDESGPVNYYTVVDDAGGDYIRSSYVPPIETTVLGWGVPEKQRRSVARVRWRWRALTLPVGGNECVGGKNDSAAVVYLTFKRGLRWYALKYVWSGVGPRGVTCDKRRNLLHSQDSIIVESGPPIGQWRTVEVDPEAEFHRHFDTGHGASTADRPEFLGIGIMSDGDQTQSPSAADFGGFVITYR
jgi:hypothetical protein